MVFSLTLPLPPGEQPRDGPSVRVRGPQRILRIRRPLPGEEPHEWLLEIEIDVTIPDPEAVLASCEGFLVDGAGGRDLGVVEEVETVEGAVSALITSGGWFGRRQARIPVAEIEAIEPESRRILVRR